MPACHVGVGINVPRWVALRKRLSRLSSGGRPSFSEVVNKSSQTAQVPRCRLLPSSSWHNNIHSKTAFRAPVNAPGPWKVVFYQRRPFQGLCSYTVSVFWFPGQYCLFYRYLPTSIPSVLSFSANPGQVESQLCTMELKEGRSAYKGDLVSIFGNMFLDGTSRSRNIFTVTRPFGLHRLTRATRRPFQSWAKAPAFENLLALQKLLPGDLILSHALMGLISRQSEAQHRPSNGPIPFYRNA